MLILCFLSEFSLCPCTLFISIHGSPAIPPFAPGPCLCTTTGPQPRRHQFSRTPIFAHYAHTHAHSPPAPAHALKPVTLLPVHSRSREPAHSHLRPDSRALIRPGPRTLIRPHLFRQQPCFVVFSVAFKFAIMAISRLTLEQTANGLMQRRNEPKVY